MEIQTALSRASSFSELLQIADLAEPHLSFWGTEFVSVSGYEGTLSIHELAARTLELLQQLNYEFSEEEREQGTRLASRVDNIYYNADDLQKDILCITKIMYIIKTIFSFEWLFYSGSYTRTQWHGEAWVYRLGPMVYNDDFEYYTRSQFQQKFGLSPEEAASRRIDLKRNDDPPRWRPPRWLQENPQSWRQNLAPRDLPWAQGRVLFPDLLLSS